jgi:hypothetical protein
MLQLLRRSWCKGNTRLLLTKKFSANNVYHSLCKHHHNYIRFNSSTAVASVKDDPSDSDAAADLILQLPPKFLRLSSSDCYDPNTHQRIDVKVDPKDGRPLRPSLAVDYAIKSASCLDEENGHYEVEFVDGYRSKFSMEWVQNQLARLQMNGPSDGNANDGGTSSSQNIAPIPWSNVTEAELRVNVSHPTSIKNTGIQNVGMATSFNDIVLGSNHEQHLTQALKVLYQYGILLVTSTPTDDDGAGVAALSSALSGGAIKTSPDTCPLAHYRYCHDNGIVPTPILPNATDGPFRTMYGSIWSTNAEMQQEGLSTADSAYSNEALPLHTDMTYYRDPPGLQLFTMVSPAPIGGESTFADGLAIAERMREKHPEEFDTLCRTVRRYRSIDESTGWHFEGSGPVFKAIDRLQNCPHEYLETIKGANRWGAVVGIRHNDLDRLPDLPHFQYVEQDRVDKYYEELEQAHSVLDNLLCSDEFRLVVALQPGETAVVANQRCLHGRQSFQSPRSVMGCYVR